MLSMVAQMPLYGFPSPYGFHDFTQTSPCIMGGRILLTMMSKSLWSKIIFQNLRTLFLQKSVVVALCFGMGDSASTTSVMHAKCLRIAFGETYSIDAVPERFCQAGQLLSGELLLKMWKQRRSWLSWMPWVVSILIMNIVFDWQISSLESFEYYSVGYQLWLQMPCMLTADLWSKNSRIDQQHSVVVYATIVLNLSLLLTLVYLELLW